MGKRKLNGTSFWQCEWTGFPMRASHCFWPTWSATGKLVKKGCYCNWESVVAHAQHLLEKKEITPDEHLAVIDYVSGLVGGHVSPAPHYDELAHTKGRMGAYEFHAACALQRDPINAVKISPSGDVFELLVHPSPTGFIFADYLHKPFAYHGPPSTFHSMRKKGVKGSDRDLSVWYYNTRELPHNPTASNLFKMQLYGDVLLVQQTREQSFIPRERFVSFTKQQFDEQFCKKRKRADMQCMTGAQYEDVKEKMQAALNAYEQAAAVSAAPPSELAKSVAPVSTDGKSLAKQVRARHLPNKHEVTPPPQVLTAA